MSFLSKFLISLSFVSCVLAMPDIWAGGATAADRLVIDVVIQGRKVVLPAEAIRVKQGDSVELHWTTDEAAELHVHGFDVELHISPGAQAVTEIEANATGRFPITSHGWGGGGHSHDALTYIEVYPR